MVARALLILTLSIAAGALWGGLTALILVPFVLVEAAFIGGAWGLILSVLPCGLLVTKPLEHALPAWFITTSLALLLTFPFDSLFLSFAGSSAMYIASCLILANILPDVPAAPDPRLCPHCNYPREGLPTSTCPECGEANQS